MNTAMTINADIERLLDGIPNNFAHDPETQRPAFPRIPQLNIDDQVASTTKILVIDDEPINVKVCQKYLQELGYKRCIGISDATRAVAQIVEEKPDLIILDVMMPYVEGYEILKHIRTVEQLKQIPVIISTADRTTRELTGISVDDKTLFINKASGLDNMRRGVKQALDRQQTS